MVVNRGDIKRKRKEDSCLSMLDDSPKRTKVHAQRKFAQGSNVSSPVITPVKEIERQDRKDVLPEPMDLLPMKRPNTEDFLTFLCFRGTPILPTNLNFFNSASMIDSRSQTDEPKTSYPKNGPILTTTVNQSQNEKPFVAFGVRKRADPIVISKQMDRKRRHALALQALRRKYQEQKMAKIRAVTISKLSEKVTNKNVVRTRSVTKNEIATKKTVTHKTNIKVIATKHITKTAINKQPIKSKMCLRSFRGRYIHKELNVKTHRKRQKIPVRRMTKPIVKKEKVIKETPETEEKSSSEFSSDDDEPLMKSVKTKQSKKRIASTLKKPTTTTTTKKLDESNVRLTRSHNKLVNTPTQRKQSIKQRRIITRLSNSIRPSNTRLKKKKMVQTSSSIIRNLRRTVNSIKHDSKQAATQFVRTTRRQIIKDKMERNSNVNIIRTRSKIDKSLEKESVAKKEDTLKNIKVQKVEEVPKKNDKISPKSSDSKIVTNKEIAVKKEQPNVKAERVVKRNDKEKVDTKTKLVKKDESPKISPPNSEKSNANKKNIKRAENTNSLSNKIEKSLIINDEQSKSNEPQPTKIVAKEISEVPEENKINTRRSSEKISQTRPTRKTKEAAAIYMELLGHKLVNDAEIDDDNESIDSFPELPNVRKTEQRENELKAKAKSKVIDKKDNVPGKNKEIEGNVTDNDSKVKVKTKVSDKKDSACKKDIDIAENIVDNKDKNTSKVKFDTKSTKHVINANDKVKNHASNSEKGKKVVAEPNTNSGNEKVTIVDKKLVAHEEQATCLKLVEVPEETPKKLSKEIHKVSPKRLSKQVHEECSKILLKEMHEESPKKVPMEVNEDSPKKLTKEIHEEDPKKLSNVDEKVQILTVNKEEMFVDKDKTECAIYKQLNPNKLETVENTASLTLKEESFLEKDACKIVNISNNDSENDSLNESDNRDCDKNRLKNKKITKTNKKRTSLDNSFSDSDEEPLSNLTKTKEKVNRVIETKTSNETDIKAGDNLVKPKRECTKRPHNYLPFSSSDDEEKFFHGFVKTETKTLMKELTNDVVEPCPHTLPSDLSCKDVSRRYGKGKVNMSNEQIEKWLNDSAMAGMNIKKEEDDMLKYEEKMSPLIEVSLQDVVDTAKLKSTSSPEEVKLDEKDFKNASRENEETLSLNSTPEKTGIKQPPTIKLTPNERKTIFKKEKSKEPIRNVNAFSVSNECSVYAFEADNEDSISTPFRRPCRRPSSTATSKSEDETKIDDLSKHSGKFRLPTLLRTDFKATNKQEAPHQAAQDDSNNANVTTQVNFEQQTFADTSNSEAPSFGEDNEQIFCASPQAQKHVSPEGNSKIVPGRLTGGENQHRTLSKLKSAGQPAGVLQKADADKGMFPPSNALQKGKIDKGMQKSLLGGKCTSDRHTEISEEVKYKIPSSPSASSSSSAKLYKRQASKTRNRLVDACTTPVSVANFPSGAGASQIVEAPSFHPTEKEFQDPLEYIEKIRSRAEKFGICRIVPPANFKPECKVSDDMRFTAYNQYVNKMLHRWGPNFKELMAIRKYLQTQNITLTHPPWIGGMEIDLPRLYQTVQSLGGLKEVIEKKKWPKVSDAMKIPKSAQDRVTKLDDIYCKYLLPYDTLSPAEREKLFDEVETEWAKRESKALLKAQRVNKVESSNTDIESDSDNESEEGIVKGRNIALNAFYRIARNTMSMWFKTAEPTAEEVEQEFWKHVTVKNNHICVHSGSIDSGNWGYGFAVSKNSPFARHAWNLKVLTNNSGSVLRAMGPIMGVTVPTLHVGMVFSACCWYRDPHSLPWIEYLHTGAHKIWYGIPDSMSKQFHNSMLKLVPNYCRNKSIWLPSDTVMIPPKLLVESGVSLCRTVQAPGQFIVVFPKVFTSSVSTGYVVSESVYFAPLYWLQASQNVFDELRKNCEPSMFSIDRLLLSITSDTRSSVDVLKQIIPAIQELCDRERRLRGRLRELGLSSTEKLPPPEAPAVRKRKKLQQDNGDYECEICRTNLFISLVNENQDDVVYCLEHVIQYVEEKRVDIKNCKLLFTYELEELDLLVDKIKNTIEIKQQKKIPYKVGLSLVK